MLEAECRWIASQNLLGFLEVKAWAMAALPPAAARGLQTRQFLQRTSQRKRLLESRAVTWRSALAPSSQAKATAAVATAATAATPGSEPCRYREVGAPVMLTPRSISPTVAWQSAAAPPVKVAWQSAAVPPQVKVTVYPPVRLESAPTSSGHERVQLATAMNGYSTPGNFMPPSNALWTPPVPFRQATPQQPVNASNVAGSVPSTPLAPWTCYSCATRSVPVAAPVSLPAKITVRWSPTAFAVPESVKEALARSRTPSPQVQIQGAAQKVSSPGQESSQLEERMRELERRLDAKENQCKHLEEHLTEVRNCLEEQKQRGMSDLKQRDQHIAELNRRNQELIAAAKMRFTVVPSDGEVEDALPQESRNESATSGEAFKRRGAASIADDVSNDKDMPTLAALRQRLYPKRNTRQDKQDGEKDHDPDPSRPRTSRQNGRGVQGQRTPPRRAS
eukprot:s1093_g8.t3